MGNLGALLGGTLGAFFSIHFVAPGISVGNALFSDLVLSIVTVVLTGIGAFIGSKMPA